MKEAHWLPLECPQPVSICCSAVMSPTPGGPGSGFAEVLPAAGVEVFGIRQISLHGLSIDRPLVLDSQLWVTVRLLCDGNKDAEPTRPLGWGCAAADVCKVNLSIYMKGNSMSDLLMFNLFENGYYSVENAGALTHSDDSLKLQAKWFKLTNEELAKRVPAYDSHLGKAYLVRAQGGLVECDLASGSSKPIQTGVHYGCVAYEPETKKLYAGLRDGGFVHSFDAMHGTRGNNVMPVRHPISDASTRNGPEGEFFGMTAVHHSATGVTFLYLIQGTGGSGHLSKLIIHEVHPGRPDDKGEFFSSGHGVCDLPFGMDNAGEYGKIDVSSSGRFLVAGGSHPSLGKVLLDSTPPRMLNIGYVHDSAGADYRSEAYKGQWAVVGNDVCLYAQGPKGGTFVVSVGDDMKVRTAHNNNLGMGDLTGAVSGPDGQWAFFSGWDSSKPVLLAYNPSLDKQCRVELSSAGSYQMYLAWR
ncbi:hypothetical protein [Streptomyces chartreusis]|uniref:hypothetical protein n=1 Tax=Streptomyces chartreusis TaxID=1969 RepID=UPI002E1952FA